MESSKIAQPRRKSFIRSYSLGSSFTSCFGGSLNRSDDDIMVENVRYIRVGSSVDDDNAAEVDVKISEADARRNRRDGNASDHSPQDLSSSSVSENPGFRAKVKIACEQMMEAAKKSSPHLSELFVGTQLLMNVTSTTPSRGSPCPHHSLSPSSGFVNGPRIS
ncbi:hypothetical protein KP509_09G080000 [Ceratopteris richardii]|uniref:Uncharacterized protein n=1 Tax=Ceratopteris richardii TaxID=49495 RepID=A0A8T2U2Q4_CERRI|nr:hypothetical protein KP509_09G080000 [Ceratopteris richardii]